MINTKTDKDILDIILNIEPILNTFSDFLEIEDLVHLKKVSKEYNQHPKLDKRIEKLLELKRQEILFNYSHFNPRTHKLEDLFEKFNHKLKNDILETYRKKGYESIMVYLLNQIFMKTIFLDEDFLKLGVIYGDIITVDSYRYIFLPDVLETYPKHHYNICHDDRSLKHFTPDTFYCGCEDYCFRKMEIIRYNNQLISNYDYEKKTSKIVIKLKYGVEFVYTVKQYNNNHFIDILYKKSFIVGYNSDHQTLYISDNGDVFGMIRLDLLDT